MLKLSKDPKELLKGPKEVVDSPYTQDEIAEQKEKDYFKDWAESDTPHRKYEIATYKAATEEMIERNMAERHELRK